MRLCFFVKVRKAKGRSVAGGRTMGRTACLTAVGAPEGVAEKDLRGCAGVANAGEEEGMSEEGGWARLAGVSLVMNLCMAVCVVGCGYYNILCLILDKSRVRLEVCVADCRRRKCDER